MSIDNSESYGRILRLPRTALTQAQIFFAEGKFDHCAATILDSMGVKAGVLRSFFIGGHSRIGKSLVAKYLTQKGFSIVETDSTRRAYYTGSKPDPGAQCAREALYRKAAQCQKRIGFEGSDILHFVKNGGSVPKENLVFWLILRESDRQWKIESLAESSRAGIDRKRDWSDCVRIVDRIIRDSKRLIEEADSIENFHLIDMGRGGASMLDLAELASTRIADILSA